jgi:Predicted ATPase (AAA+ superfamily)
MYIKRTISETVAKAAKMFGAVLVTGPRQVGKTTLLTEVAKSAAYITLDNPVTLKSAIEEGGTFFKDNPPPVFVDEIQYAPNLFPYIKMIADEKKGKGLFYMSGSQQFRIMKNVGESLAGRLGILNLLGLSLRELNGTEYNNLFYRPSNILKAGEKGAERN